MVNQVRNIVIIGASAAGHTLANELIPTLPEGYRILLIDALEYSFFPIAALRAAVVPGWEERIVLPLKTSTCFPSDSIHQVIAPNRVIKLKENLVVLEKPFEGTTEVRFYKAIIATGSTQPSPMRPSLEWNMKDYLDALKKSQQEIKQAESLVVVGGGTVGVEFAGEVRALYPDKQITIIHNRSTLLTPLTESSPSGNLNEKIPESYTSPPTHLKLANSLTNLVKGHTNLILNDKVIIPQPDEPSTESNWNGSFGLQPSLVTIRTESGKSVKADYVFLSVGNKPNSGLVRVTDPSAVEGKTGLIKVDEYLKVKSTIPGGENYYAIGDVSNAPGVKTSYIATVQAKSAAVNLINEIKNKPLIAYSPGTFGGLFVPFGPELGAASITLPYLGTWTVGSGMVRSMKGRKLLLDRWGGLWKGEEKVEILV
ncbi:hypothetical protein I302_104159 [Kwoniella bestiolae CBS 10118]|uniref:FAD/NAD(P)-binding domain-containing protein n=1 Tax=Kwoniella bestiolae CBS 10118 TaxID=1296100 RepID=A0A1B9GAH0_9TREE|nr:hypothetical protein I302_02866 [Kwoniella bestiolae CBS 10118]OCF28015.1 hypothetical protein I302_02866 [Kwoniella bestiolae CBS 10118]